ncbi:MAG: glutamine--fructose-6-phosphate transaminase (isomerizing) [Planctomycetia bacterium]|jgi:glucosamine--fructose-6-phosphate aminotransferase (isomerizing)|nr:glutamine--fructose-6-phosphate transaminase (isomerizing) [Planctomycetia bacterium]MCC7314846.1 glutamine--fructose-6-phosphate transaminase (isomerizing) [Planctomycetota bacterium]
MCGIVGYTGFRQAQPILLEGLKRLEYRGYDSSGIAIQSNGHLNVRKKAGRISVLESTLSADGMPGTCGISHTRWATHGAPNDLNAHPHVDASGRIALIHNGIIENYQALRTYLEHRGVEFKSETDTEVLAQLIGHFYTDDIESAVRAALRDVRGTYGLAVLCSEEPGKIVAARKGSPLILGIGDGEYVVASDAAAIVQHMTQVIYLSDGEMAVVWDDGFRTTTLDALPVTKEVTELELSLEDIELGGHEHFMLKEIMEQPECLSDGMRGRVNVADGRIHLGGLANQTRELVQTKRLILTACGTAWHAGLVGEYLFEQLARIPTEVEYASEFRYRNPTIEPGTVVVAISQSGETADTLSALREAREKGALALGVVNAVGSTIARESDAGVYLHVGPEIGVASTKAYLGQVLVLTMMALYMGRRKHLSQSELLYYLKALEAIPEKIRSITAQSQEIRRVAERYKDAENWLYLGRGYNYPTALEGALKLKEISYIHAEGMPAAEIKHGPIALITKDMPVVFIATKNSQYEKIISNIEEVRARSGRVIAVATEGDTEIARLAEHVFYVPDVPEPLQPLVTIVPLQLLAYHAAVLRGCDVDKPRNLAKSVTVE